MNRLTASLITLNEEQNLPRALTSLRDIADEIVVVDAGSADRTREIAAEHGARIFLRAWTDYSDQKNFAAAQAECDWVLSLDADEELSAELRASLAGWKKQEPRAAAYEISRRANYLGRWIRRSGWYPDRKVRLYRRDRGRFVGAVHESVEVNGAIEPLEGDLLHYAYRTAAEHEAKVQRYTTLAAQQLFAGGRRRWRLAMFVAPVWAFARTWIFQQGFRDGTAGWQIARMAARYVRLKYRKLGVLGSGGTLEEARKARDARP
jgi:glycosyltransferase involved in cell wall biosynthesis